MNTAIVSGWKNVNMIFCCAARSVTQTNSLQTARVPTIRFRKGGTVAAVSPSSSPSVATTPAVSKSTARTNYANAISSRTQQVLEDYQLPLKYRRRPIDEKEIEYINRGGPE